MMGEQKLKGARVPDESWSRGLSPEMPTSRSLLTGDENELLSCSSLSCLHFLGQCNSIPTFTTVIDSGQFNKSGG